MIYKKVRGRKPSRLFFFILNIKSAIIIFINSILNYTYLVFLYL